MDPSGGSGSTPPSCSGTASAKAPAARRKPDDVPDDVKRERSRR
ncbi:MAG: hypothetical protein R3F43_09010 [bacterium]